VIHGINMPETQSLNPVRVERIEDPEAQCSANAPSAMLKEGRQSDRRVPRVGQLGRQAVDARHSAGFRRIRQA
jgi:hypothetical protein